MKEAFELQTAAQRPGRGLPHLPLNEDGLTPLPGSGVSKHERLDHKDSAAPPDDSRKKGDEDGDEEQPHMGLKHSDKMIRNMFINKADCMESLRKEIGARAVREPEFKDALLNAGIVLNNDDATTLFRRAAKDGVVRSSDVMHTLNQVRLLSEETPSSLLGFGTGERMFKPVGPMAKFKGSWGVEDPGLQKIYKKVANSSVGNPRRLRQLFRKFDMDRNGDVTSSEFLSALLANHVPLTREEARKLAYVADTGDRGVVLYEEFISTVAQVSGQRNPKRGSSNEMVEVVGAGAEPNQSMESIGSSVGSRPSSSMGQRARRERSLSQVSVGSIRSERSVASSRGTLGGSVRSERSDWMMDSTLRDCERKESRRYDTPLPVGLTFHTFMPSSLPHPLNEVRIEQLMKVHFAG